MTDADVVQMFEATGELVYSSGVPAYAHFDLPTRSVLDGRVLDEEPSITLATYSLPLLKRGSSVTVRGVSYTVREVTLVDDGAVKRATLKAV